MNFASKNFGNVNFSEQKLGEFVEFSGKIITARDRAHSFFLEATDSELAKLGINLNGAIIYHCGPIMRKADSSWKAVSAGPTTSARMGRFIPELIERFGIKAVIGKGGMNKEVAEAMKGKCIYLHAVGGTGALLAQRIKKVDSVSMLDEFGMAEAVWQFEVKNFPVVVTIDAHGNSLHEKILQESRARVSSGFQ